MNDDSAFQEWKERAQQVSLLEAAQRCGFVLKRSGSEHVGPCRIHGGKDTFGISPVKNKWICRRGGEGGSGPIGLTMHAMGFSYLEAIEFLTGEPKPGGKAKPLSLEEKKKREQRRLQAEREAKERERRQAKYIKERLFTAESIWSERKPLQGSLAEKYLTDIRGIPVPPIGWPQSLAFHSGLEYERDRSRRFPALIAKVEDVTGKLVAVHAIYLDPRTGRKAPVDPCKISIGPMSGGSVRLWGSGKRVGICEGLETGLAIGWIVGFRFPIFSCLSTAGVTGLELPLEVERTCCWPDSDRPLKRMDGVYIPLKKKEEAPGIRAMREFQKKYSELGVRVTINEPLVGLESTDYLDFLQIIKRNGLHV